MCPNNPSCVVQPSDVGNERGQLTNGQRNNEAKPSKGNEVAEADDVEDEEEDDVSAAGRPVRSWGLARADHCGIVARTTRACVGSVDPSTYLCFRLK